MSHTTGGIGQESGRIRFQDWIFIGLSGERTETVGRENRSIFSDLFGLVGESLCESRLLRNVTSVFFLLFFFFPANGIALDGSETAMAPLLNDASRHRQRGLVIETDNRWTCFNSFDFEPSITLLLFDDSKPTGKKSPRVGPDEAGSSCNFYDVVFRTLLTELYQRRARRGKKERRLIRAIKLRSRERSCGTDYSICEITELRDCAIGWRGDAAQLLTRQSFS